MANPRDIRRRGRACGRALFLSFFFVRTISSALTAHAFVPLTFPNGSAAYWTEGQASLNLLLGCGIVPLPHWGPCWDDAATDAFTQWNNAAVRFHFFQHIPPLAADPCVHDDRVNTVAFATSKCGMGFGAALSITFLRAYESGALVDTDILVNATQAWSTYPGPVRWDPVSNSVIYDFHRVMLHEFGHIVGLGHPDEAGQAVPAIMNHVYGNTDALQPDDITGINAIYPSTSTGQLANVSTRGFVGTGDNVLIGGFIVEEGATTVLVRAIGPSLTARGVAGALANPSVQVFSGQTPIAFNDDWQTTPGATEIPAAFRPSDPREAALLITLPPGPYTAIVRGVGNTTGVALVEVFRL